MKIQYRGKDLEECSREELIAACEWAMDALERAREFERQEREMNVLFRKAILK